MRNFSGSEVDEFVSSLDLSDPDMDWKKFCDHWPEIMKFLEYIKDRVGFPVNTIIDVVIAIGDGIMKEKCGDK